MPEATERNSDRAPKPQPATGPLSARENITFDSRSNYALQRMACGENNLLITGKAGTGKSTLLTAYLRDRPEGTAVVAPTGVAALRVGGQTIHRFFGFSVNVTPETARRMKSNRSPNLFKSLRTLIIDEVSMLRADLHDCIDMFLRKFGPQRNKPFGGVHMIYVGDLYQLPPVVTRSEREFFWTHYDSPYFFSAGGVQETSLEIIELEKIHRQHDPVFIDILENIRNNSVTDEDINALNRRVDPDFESGENGFYVTLTSTNARADKINAEQLGLLSSRKRKSTAEISGDFTRDYFPAPVELEYKAGAQIMLLNNDSDGRWVNGSTGVIQTCGTDSAGMPFVRVLLNDSSDSVRVEPHEWQVYRPEPHSGTIEYVLAGRFRQLPFRLAWAVTIHKSQGLTLDKTIIDLTRVFSHGQAYVALSRCRTLEGIILTRPIERQHIRTDWRVQKYLAARAREKSADRHDRESRRKLLEDALLNQTQVQIEYVSAKNQRTVRILTPTDIGKREYKGSLYDGLEAYCHERRAMRNFRLDGIVKVEPVRPHNGRIR